MTIKQWFCSLRGDHGLLKIEDGRVYLACPACGWESNGVTVTPETEESRATRGSANRAPDPHIMLLKRAHDTTTIRLRLKSHT